MYSDDARKAIIRGVDKVAKAVSVTLGPGGSNVVIESDNVWVPPIVTKDGVTVARSIKVADPAESIGAQLLKQAAIRTNDTVGDGTTSSIVLAQAVVHEGNKQVGLNRNGIRIKEGIEEAARDVVEVIDSMAKPITAEDYAVIENLATISGNDEHVGKTVADAFTSVGGNGFVTFHPGGLETVLKHSKGMNFDSGLLSPYFITDRDKLECVMEDVDILLFEDDIKTAPEMADFLTVYLKENPRKHEGNLLIIGNVPTSQDAFMTLAKNRAERGYMFACVKAPGYGARVQDWYEDLAVITGAEFIRKESGTRVNNVSFRSLGKAKKIIIDLETTTLIGSASDEVVAAHVNKLKEKQNDPETPPFQKEYLELRIAKLTSGICIISIGANTEAEMKEKKYRFEDAVAAVKTALKNGIVVGGGMSFIRAAQVVKANQTRKFKDGDVEVGYNLFLDTLKAPLLAIATNAGYNGSVVYQKVLEHNEKTGERGRPNKEKNLALAKQSTYGFNARTGEYGDMFDFGIIDPAFVSRQVVLSASSVAGTILTTEALVYNLPDSKE